MRSIGTVDLPARARLKSHPFARLASGTAGGVLSRDMGEGSNGSGSEMHVVDVRGYPQGVGSDGQTGVQTCARREERGVDYVKVGHFVRPVLGVQHAGFRIGTKATGAAHVAQV